MIFNVYVAGYVGCVAR